MSDALPTQLQRHPQVNEFELDDGGVRHWYDGTFRASPVAVRRLGPTIWYRSGGQRQVVIERDDSVLTVLELFHTRKQSYKHSLYVGSDLAEAVKIANATFNGFAADGYKSHSQCWVGIQEWFGLDTAWDHDPFSVREILDSLRLSAAYKAQQYEEERERYDTAAALGLSIG